MRSTPRRRNDASTSLRMDSGRRFRWGSVKGWDRSGIIPPFVNTKGRSPTGISRSARPTTSSEWPSPLMERETQVEILEEVANGEHRRLVDIPDEAGLADLESGRDPAEHRKHLLRLEALRGSGRHQLGSPRADYPKEAVGNELEGRRAPDIADIVHFA